MAEDILYIYDVRFELIGTGGIVFEGEIKINDFTLKSERFGAIYKITGNVIIKLSEYNCKLAKKLAMKKIQQELLPLLVLTSGEGYRINKLKLESARKMDGENINILIVNEIRAEARAFTLITEDNIEQYLKELESCMNKIENLKKGDRKDFLRAVRYWNRGRVDGDGVDRFIDFYIAFEILGKNLAKNENQWVKEVCENHDLRREYEGAKINEIRDALVHAKHRRLSKEEAEVLAVKYADVFGRDVFKLIIDFLNIRLEDFSRNAAQGSTRLKYDSGK